jgi:flagellar protein FliO/FliZ
MNRRAALLAALLVLASASVAHADVVPPDQPATTAPADAVPTVPVPTDAVPAAPVAPTAPVAHELAPYDTGLGTPATTDPGIGPFLWQFVKTMLALGIVLALVYLVLHKGLGRLVQRTQIGKRMRVVERIQLEPRRSLYLVDVDGEEMLLSASEGGVQALERPTAAAAAVPPPSFSETLESSSNAPAVTRGARDTRTSEERSAPLGATPEGEPC